MQLSRILCCAAFLSSRVLAEAQPQTAVDQKAESAIAQINGIMNGAAGKGQDAYQAILNALAGIVPGSTPETIQGESTLRQFGLS